MLLAQDIAGLTPAVILFAALALDALFGEFGPLFRAIPHPVAAIGGLIGLLDRRLNRERDGDGARFARGAAAVLLMVALAGAAGWLLTELARSFRHGWAIELAAVALLLAQRSLFDHVRAVGRALERDGLEAGRAAVARIVGRDPGSLDEHAVARAAIESLAENFADAVAAPAFWYLLFGLPGLLVCKTVNTMDSMIGHRTPRHAAFGRAAARLDDALNCIPARLAALLIAAAGLFVPGGRAVSAFRTIARDAGKHRSPNAGWPEAAMAGGLGVALAGPRSYAGVALDEPWLGGEFSTRTVAGDIRRALRLFVAACLLHAAIVAAIAHLSAPGPDADPARPAAAIHWRPAA